MGTKEVYAFKVNSPTSDGIVSAAYQQTHIRVTAFCHSDFGSTVLASTTCMGGVHPFRPSRAIKAPISRHASHGFAARTVLKSCPLEYMNWNLYVSIFNMPFVWIATRRPCYGSIDPMPPDASAHSYQYELECGKNRFSRRVNRPESCVPQVVQNCVSHTLTLTLSSRRVSHGGPRSLITRDE